MKPLLRVWHFFRGHPARDLYSLYYAAEWEDQQYECEGCGKAGRRL